MTVLKLFEVNHETVKEVKIFKEVKIVKEVKRSDGLGRFACGDVLFERPKPRYVLKLILLSK